MIDMSGEDFFTCERLKCRLRKQICVTRQDSGSFLSCKHCPQGEENIKIMAESTENITIDADTATGTTPTIDDSNNAQNDEFKTCKECGKKFYKEDTRPSLWSRQKFCTVSCASKNGQRKRYKKETMMEKQKEYAKTAKAQIDVAEIAADHWSYIENLLTTHMVDGDLVEIVGFHYRTAFVHGWKHAMEAR